jgi:uncharacterized protein (DUF697 family)
MGKSKVAGKLVAPIALKAAPAITSSFVRQAFDRAVDGVGPLKGAAESADHRLAQQDGKVDKAIGSLVDSHVQLAGIQGFLTNIGGLVALTVTVPANISGLALLQCHMVGGIAHLRGYDLEDPRVRNAVLACMLGGDTIQHLLKRKKIPTSPMAMATAPTYDPNLDDRITAEVASELLARVAGKRTVAAMARKVPIVGGGFGAVADGYATYQVGRYAAKELRSRRL